MSAHIECQDLVRIFSAKGFEVQALQGLNLDVAAGELMAIVGSSGSGKSTLLGILAGADSPTAGSARVAGRDLGTMTGSQRTRYRRSVVGFVFQETSRNPLPYLSAAQNIALPMVLAGVRASTRAQRVSELLGLLGMVDLADRLPAALSGGQQQRVAIATALANSPEVLLADEPTGELDEAGSRGVFDAIRSVNQHLGTTVLIVTHDEGVSSHVDRTVQIRDGRTSTEVLRGPALEGAGIEDRVTREFVVLDRAGRLQLPQEYVSRLSLRDRVRLELGDDHVRVHAAEPATEGAAQ